MSFLSAALCYLLLFRLSIVAAGIVSIALGYRLFCKGIGLQASGDTGSTIESSLGPVKIAAWKVAPGTCYALFGALLLIVMMVQARPSVTLDTLSKWQIKSDTEESTGGSQSQKVVMKGGEGQNSIDMLTAQGIEFEGKKDTANAQRSYEDAVKKMAEPMNDLAWIYLNSGRAKDAIGLATLAVQLRPGEDRYIDTLQKARQAMK
jgi:hypothetical protein